MCKRVAPIPAAPHCDNFQCYVGNICAHIHLPDTASAACVHGPTDNVGGYNKVALLVLYVELVKEASMGGPSN